MNRAHPERVFRRALWWTADYVYAGWRQVRAVWRRPTADTLRDGRGAPVVIVPGVYEPWLFMLPLIRDLREAGHPVHVVEALQYNTLPVAESALLVEQLLLERDLRDVVIIAHSKGGLIGKQAMTAGPAAERIRNMVAIATPFAGSSYARFLRGAVLRSFSPTDKTIMSLAQSLVTNARIVSVFPVFDPHIPGGSELVGARNVAVPTGGHFRVLAHRQTRAEVLRAVSPSTAQT